MNYKPTAKDKAFMREKQKLQSEILRLKDEVQYWKSYAEKALESSAQFEQLYLALLEHSEMTHDELLKHIKSTETAAGLVKIMQMTGM